MSDSTASHRTSNPRTPSAPSSTAVPRPSWLKQPRNSPSPTSSPSVDPSSTRQSFGSTSSNSSPTSSPSVDPSSTRQSFGSTSSNSSHAHAKRRRPPPNIGGPSAIHTELFSGAARSGSRNQAASTSGQHGEHGPLFSMGGVFPEEEAKKRENGHRRKEAGSKEQPSNDLLASRRPSSDASASRRPSSDATVGGEDDVDQEKLSRRPPSSTDHLAHSDVSAARTNDRHPHHDNSPDESKDEQAIGGQLNQDDEDWEEDFDHNDEDLPIRNGLGALRYALREPAAEFLSTLILMIIGLGANCQATLSSNTNGNTATMYFAWGLGVMSSIYVAGGVSGGHANPVVTIALWLFRGFPLKMVPRYIVAQVLGAFCGALIIWGNYSVAIKSYDLTAAANATVTSHASATLFVTAPITALGGTAIGFAQEVLASGTLMVAVLALGDEGNAPPGAGLGAIVLGLVVTAICLSNGWISGFASNPARDLGPRLALSALGYGHQLWTHNDWWWASGAIAGPLVGSIAGAALYDLLIFTGPGSPLNYTSRELVRASGIPRAHNMVRKAVNPSYRRSQNAAAAAESGRAGSERPSRDSGDDVDELAVPRRLQRGREKVEKVGRKQDKEEMRSGEERRRSTEGSRGQEQQRQQQGGTSGQIGGSL